VPTIVTPWRRPSLWLMSLVVTMASLVNAAPAVEIVFQGRAVKRHILAVYDGKREGPPHLTRLHKLAEMPLNHLGFILDFRDVNQPLPEGEELDRYRGIASWLVEPLDNPPKYLAWLDTATDRGLKYVQLGEIAPREADELFPLINRILARIGLEHMNNFVELTYRTRIAMKDDAMIGFERKIDRVLPGFPMVTTEGGGARTHLVLEVPLSSGLQRSVVVATSERGGYVAQNYTVLLEPNTERVGWVINPFAFFRAALGDERFPIPDVTTVSGRRLYFSHIDGDGWNNLSEVEGYRANQTLSAEVIGKEAIEAYPDLPVSVGLIAGDVMPMLGGNPAGAQIAKRLFALPQVEVASHTHSHPYRWNFFELYDRATEEKLIKSYRPPDQPIRERISGAILRAAGKRDVAARYDSYIAGSDDLPRTYLREPFQLELEVRGALTFSENLAPRNKRAKLYQWSGDTTPFEAAIKATREAGVRNINGGDARLDREFPSVAYVPSIGRLIGRERQIYSVNSNENTYTNDWTGPFSGQLMLSHTLDNTDTPRRLKGFNLYYHMYSGEKQASLTAIKKFLERARASQVAPVAASHYAAIADSYFGVEIEQVGLFSWSVQKPGQLSTVRFDAAATLMVDYDNSQGVVGSNRLETTLYVAIDPAAERIVVALKGRDDAVPSRDQPMSLVQGRWLLSEVVREPCQVRMKAEGFGKGDMVWQVAAQQGYRVVAERGGRTVFEEVRWSDARGELKFSVAADAIEPLTMRVRCHD
jgi:polysaccharide biosynthesis protein PelA